MSSTHVANKAAKMMKCLSRSFGNHDDEMSSMHVAIKAAEFSPASSVSSGSCNARQKILPITRTQALRPDHHDVIITTNIYYHK